MAFQKQPNLFTLVETNHDHFSFIFLLLFKKNMYISVAAILKSLV